VRNVCANTGDWPIKIPTAPKIVIKSRRLMNTSGGNGSARNDYWKSRQCPFRFGSKADVFLITVL
jgi:hypothetical protein